MARQNEETEMDDTANQMLISISYSRFIILYILLLGKVIELDVSMASFTFVRSFQENFTELFKAQA